MLLRKLASNLLALLSGQSSGEIQSAKQIFEGELNRHQIAFSVDAESGRYVLQNASFQITVSLENVVRNYQKNKDPEEVIAFVGQFLQILSTHGVPEWSDAVQYIYFSAERSDHEFGDSLRTPITDSISRVLVFYNHEKGLITWITVDILKRWGVTQEETEAVAYSNMNSLFVGKSVETINAGDLALGAISVSPPFKASTIFARDFKKFVSVQFGWPVLAIIPNRDFLYIISEKDSNSLSRLADVIGEEYKNSSYPLSTDVLRISDNGIEAIAHFKQR